MAYAVVADVQAEFKSISFTSTTQVTTTKVGDWIAEADAEINSIIGIRYQTPVPSSTDAAKICKTISIWLVKDRIRGVLEIKQVEDKVDQDVAGKSLRDRALEWAHNIAKGWQALPGALLITVSGGSLGGLESYNRSRDDSNEFRKGEDQW